MSNPPPARICGVICEYNPFHKGHAYQLARARELSGARVVVCVMSGPFTQRGDPALVSPRVRAEMALTSGADLVVELPAAFALREAEFFALGGVTVLKALGADCLSFGCENGDIAPLQHAAALLEKPTEAFSARLHEGLQAGLSYAKAQGEALEACLPDLDRKAAAAPNNVLAICYLRALMRLECAMELIPVRRLGDYHDSLGQAGFASATAVRAALVRGDWGQAQAMVPEAAWDVLREAMEAGRVHRPGALDLVLRDRLRQMDEKVLRAYPNVGEGLEHRLLRLRAACVTREDLLAAVKTKRYTYARLNRLLTHILLNMTAESLAAAKPQSFRLLGFKESARPYLASLPKGLLYTKPASQERDESLRLDMAAYDLWAIGAGLSMDEGFRQQVAVIRD